MSRIRKPLTLEQKKAKARLSAEYRKRNFDLVRERERAIRKSPEGKRAEYARQVRSCYKLELEDLARLYEAQAGKCANAGCQKVLIWDKRASDGHNLLHIDHQEQPFKVRGLLCHDCNVALGQVEECPKRLRGLAEYICAHKLL